MMRCILDEEGSMQRKRPSGWLAAALASALAALLASCSGGRSEFAILASSESASLDPLLRDFAKEERVRLRVDYRGSIDIMLELSSEEPSYDAVWPANSLWLQLGDVKKRAKGVETIMTSPVVFGVRSSLAEKFGWKGRKVLVRDIMARIRSRELSFMMASASQSNSGAGAYLGFLYALAGNPVVL
jgi:Ca-activated chloride channel homolog